MDPIRNPFAPGAGSQPPELAGRDDIIESADIALQRCLAGKSARSQVLLGLRGTGKTVLLNKIEGLAEDHGHVTAFIEAPEHKPLTDLLYPRLFQAVRALSRIENAKHKAFEAMGALRSFVGTFKVEMGDMAIAIDPLAGVADSGNLEYDLSDLFIRIGQAALAAGKGWTLLIDEIQYLDGEALSALIVAIHRINQKQLPVIFFGAGLPQVAGLTGDAKSYAERLFEFRSVDALTAADASEAIRQPIEEEEEAIDEDALHRIYELTHGYPYFLQEWGFQAWNVAQGSPISVKDVEKASDEAIRRLDDSFFRVRLDRLTPKERGYVMAMAQLGPGPYRSADVAEALGQSAQQLGPCRATVISKGMIYSPSHGDVAFTVPLFDEYLRRIND